jgi:hypothetical protein
MAGTARSRATVKAVTGTDTVVPADTEQGVGSVGTPVEGNAEDQGNEEAKDQGDEEVKSELSVEELMALRSDLLAAEDVDTEALEKLEASINARDPFALMDEAKEQTEFKRGPAAIDYEAITSPRVKADLQKSFNAFKPATVPGKPGTTAWLTQRFPSAALAEAYFNQAKKYATFRDWTFRSAWMKETESGVLVNVKADDTAKPTILRFAAKPKESRTRKS